MRTPACALTSLLSSLQPPRSDSPAPRQPPTLPPSTPPATLLPHFTYNLAPPSLSHSLFSFSCPTPSSFSTSLLVHRLSFCFTHLLFPSCFLSLAPSFAVWVFPVFHHAPRAHCAACLCLYGNPAWTGVAQRSVRH